MAFEKIAISHQNLRAAPVSGEKRTWTINVKTIEKMQIVTKNSNFVFLKS